MNDRPRIAVVGYGNIGRSAVDAVLAAPDLQLAGIVRRDPSRRDGIDPALPVAGSVEELGKVDVALLCLPTRLIPAAAPEYLERGIHTVDSYDIHGSLVDVKKALQESAEKGGSVAILSAGWDPGTNSMVRALFELMAPKGLTYTNYGPGMSMGHSVAVRAVEGVADGFSVTVPLGQGLHRRMVYVVLEEGAELDAVAERIKADPYFCNDETHVVQVGDVEQLVDMGHGAVIERKGVSGVTHNQLFRYELRINNPALTAQIMVSAARAALRQAPGAYTMLEIPLIDFLPGSRDELLRRLV